MKFEPVYGDIQFLGQGVSRHKARVVTCTFIFFAGISKTDHQPVNVFGLVYTEHQLITPIIKYSYITPNGRTISVWRLPCLQDIDYVR